MAKVTIPKRSYYVFQSMFYSFILSGLAWQVTKISVNFFKFEIVSDIKVIMPEKENLTKYFNLCFVNYQVIDHDRYAEYYKSRNVTSNFNYEIPVKDRFNLTNHRVAQFTYEVIRYIRDAFICYHGKDELPWVKISTSLLPKVTVVGAFFSQIYPIMDFERVHYLLEFGQMSESTTLYLSSNVYTMERLQFPYTDKCIKYRSTQIVSFKKCSNEKTMSMSRKLSRVLTIAENEDIDFLNMTIISRRISYKECDEILLHPDCYENSIFTHLRPGAALLENDEIMLILIGDKNALPSFSIISKPRIDNIDYVTYVFGALGSWIGFCFLQLNPIGIFFQHQDIAVSNNSTNNLSVSRNRVIKLEQSMELKLNKCNRDIAESKQEIAESKNKIEESKQEIAILKRKLNRIIQYLNKSQK